MNGMGGANLEDGGNSLASVATGICLKREMNGEDLLGQANMNLQTSGGMVGQMPRYKLGSNTCVFRVFLLCCECRTVC